MIRMVKLCPQISLLLVPHSGAPHNQVCLSGRLHLGFMEYKHRLWTLAMHYLHEDFSGKTEVADLHIAQPDWEK